MQTCSRCLYTSIHPLNLTFDAEGVCSGCRIHEEKDLLDWSERLEKLKKIANDYRCRSQKNYDCIVPVSGARDSYFIVHTVKNVLGLNPLLVTYNKHYNTETGIRNLANLRITFDTDIMTLTVNPETVKSITRATLRKRGSIYWHCIAGQTVFPVQVATRLKIPLIIWGAHQGVDQVGMYSHLHEVEMTRKYRKDHDLMGLEAEDLVDSEDFINEETVAPYLYPSDLKLTSVGVRGIYLNNYIRWDSKAQNEAMIKQYGYESTQQSRTFDSYRDVDSYVYSDVHDYIKHAKYGYGIATDHACREIRLRRLDREQALELVGRYQAKPMRFLSPFLEWIGMTYSGFHYIIDQHRDPRVWRRNENWEWVQIMAAASAHSVGQEKRVALSLTEKCDFIVTSRGDEFGTSSQYTLVGKGYPPYSEVTQPIANESSRAEPRLSA